jgi:hypothetical protein
MDPSKVEVVQAWSVQTTVRCTRTLWVLGLTGYYRKFIKDYGTVARPLTQLLKREAFLWYVEADAAFTVLKLALTPGQSCNLPAFSVSFNVNCNASGSGFGAVLHQDADPSTY